jgi:hypothetical protein
VGKHVAVPKPLPDDVKSLPFSILTVRLAITTNTNAGNTKDGAGNTAMQQRKRARESQETQHVSSAEIPGAEPMTIAQASYLKTLAEEVQEPGVYRQGLSRHEASRRINALIEKLRLGALPPHTD